MNRIRETRPAPRYGLLWAFVRRMLLLYAAWAVCRVIFYLMNASIIGPVGLNELPHLLRGSLAFDTASILYVNAPFILLSLLPFRFRERKGYQRMLLWLYSTVNGIALAINLSDGIYFHYARKRFTADELSYLGNNDNTGTVVLKAMAENWYVVLLAVALIFGLVRCYRRIRFAPARREGRRYFLVNLGVLAAGVALTLGGIRGGFSRQTRPITLSNATLYTSSDRKANLILSNPFCLLRTLGNRSLSYTRFFDSETLDSLYSPYHDPKPDTTALGPRNIVIFVLESFSSEHSALLNPDLYPDGRGFTPFLDSLMREGYCFPNAFANGHKSIEALPSVLSSIPSYRTPFVLMPQALAETKALPALLADEGYSTSFFNGSGRGSMGFGAYATLAGVQRYYSREDYEKVCSTGDFDGYWGIWDEPFLQYMSRTLSETPEPFFASAFTLTSHHPFVVPERYADTLPKGKTKVHQGVAYTDMALKKFMETSSKEPWFRRTIFVFVADHVSSETFAPKTLTPTGNTRIVCLIYTPDGSVRGRHESVVQQIDLMPTLLGLLGYDKPYFAFGRDVLHETGRTAMATNSAGDIYQGITDSLVLFFDGERTTSAYLRSDTLQRQDVSDRRTPLLEEAERQLKARLQQYYEHVERRDYLAPEQKTPPTGRAER